MTLCTYVIIYVRRKINFYISPPCTTPTWDCVFFQGPTRTRFSAALLYQQGEESADLGCCNTGIAG